MNKLKHAVMMDEQEMFHRFTHPGLERIYWLTIFMPHEFFKKLNAFLLVEIFSLNSRLMSCLPSFVGVFVYNRFKVVLRLKFHSAGMQFAKLSK